MSIVIVTGTGTDVGKTVATAALAACAQGRVAVVKPAQTGVAPGAPGDLAEVTRLTGITDVHEFARYPDPLSPHHAAQVSGLPEVTLADAVRRIVDLDALHDLVIVEGAGGLLVPFTSGPDGWTIAELAATLRARTVLVTRAGLGTLNDTALAVERMQVDSIRLHGLIIGSWPDEPDLAARCNLADLDDLAGAARVAGVLPAGMAAMRDFRKQARAALAPKFGGTFRWSAFLAANQP